MKYLKLFENFDEENEIIFSAETQRGKYKIDVYQSDYDIENGGYSFKEYTGKRSTGGGGRQTKLDMESLLNNIFDGSSKIDNINYIVKTNKQDFRILSVNKDEPPRSERYFKQLLQGMNGQQTVQQPTPIQQVVGDVPVSHVHQQMISNPMSPIQ